MCLIKNSEGKLLFLNRKKSTWPGITFPGGHVENNETYLESVVREIKEEKYGKKFDPVKFHEAILKIGPAPFDIIDKYFDDYYKQS